ncbi:MAG TPA: Rv2231c family pyridoxal phosphate-dependent protein CobC [Actinocrinis sp.]|nr:Rv2231c family pyridoxal phosphate-dependent protein CobC [Actinocrinis sp.]
MTSARTPHPTYDLSFHGDQEIADGLVDLAVNVRLPKPPSWLLQRITASLDDLAAYPDPTLATELVAATHGRPVDQVLLTAGAAEAFVLIARALNPRRVAVVHPQFTEPEAALTAVGHVVKRVILAPEHGFRLDPALVPRDADLVVLGNPTNPTSVLHPAGAIAALARPGRILVVDEAFMDAVPGEPESLARRTELPGLVVIRSLTKTWGLAGLRIGYVLGPAEILGRLRAAQPKWPVSAPALAAAAACVEPHALTQAAGLARSGEEDRHYLESRLAGLPRVTLPAQSRAPFVLVHTPGAERVRMILRERGFAVRRADTFPGLGPDWLRIAVRARTVTNGLISAWPAD